MDELEEARASAAEQAATAHQIQRTSVSSRRPLIIPDQSQTAATASDGAGFLGVATAAAQQAVARLGALDAGKPLTPEQAAAVKQDLQQLIAEGAGSVPAIHQFLGQNKDLSLDEMKTGSPVGYGSLRAGMFDALRQIGGPEAQAALSGTLRTTGDPGEVAALARHLESMAPGQYRDEAVNAARETLAEVVKGKTGTDVAPLFQVLQTYGDANAVGDLQQAIPQYQHYGLLALANMPEGQGIPTLIQQAQQVTAGGTVKNVFASQMLAQIASQYPEAGAALVEQAKANQIPDRGWARIAEALSGDQYQFVRDPGVDMSMLLKTPGTKTYHINSGNENFYSNPLSANIPETDRAQRLALIDQLLAANTQPAAAEALQKARSRLTGK